MVERTREYYHSQEYTDLINRNLTQSIKYAVLEVGLPEGKWDAFWSWFVQVRHQGSPNVTLTMMRDTLDVCVRDFLAAKA